MSAFAHMMRRDVKVIQPGLVYVIDWSAGWDPADLAILNSTASPIAPHTSTPASQGKIKSKKKGKPPLPSSDETEQDDDDEDEGSGGVMETVYVA